MSTDALDVTEIRWHSRGGQGGMTASQLLAAAAFRDGKEATAFSFYGAERRGAPVTSYNRLSTEPIKLYSQVARPDVVIVLDDSLVDVESVTEGLAEDGVVVANTTDPEQFDVPGRLVRVDATTIAQDHGLQADGSAIVNTPILGAVARTDLVTLETLTDVIGEAFGSTNASAARAAYDDATEE
ncbi:Pyruvate:ferredoxin oxidoreductase or related 2-oxoacid:ferredoxin oxidoreductase, gamma subunit [Halanaeroarchaeum sp. HSR-CO]|uniref:2-oxoacid:acceptor oxidoreductase family protein n=1 Tax=Halanaeroarchaeum sp. HSR-CO TaxID=2866382 RepID=UPI00217EAA23|nr:2-oxoacid:acceptor oxidoreductase family protein [Halanaeroarchaeum sp. HSR-CO]UWG46857.1 Pyruvate:ferredoxin oxidoreductase or related 2-oxoacid:ferredoxin oxidoreductase, gamma subunit [Halanaeroarchaeum sp. HSR-CO]